MTLKNTQYDALIREYNRKQVANRHNQNANTTLAYAQIPALSKIDKQVAALGIKHARKLLDGDEQAIKNLKKELKMLSQKRVQLLTEHDYPANFLDLHFDCLDCQDTGFIENQKCHCFKQASIDLLYTQSNIKEILNTENFNTFSFNYFDDSKRYSGLERTALENMQHIVSDCKQFIADFDKGFSNLFFYGNTGVGKTFLTHCIAKELLESTHSVIYFSAFDLFNLFSKATFERGSEKANLQEMYSHIFDCDLLVIDDLGTELTNSFVSSQLFLCINERLMRKKSTIISTNLTLDILQETYSERVSSRIVSNYQLYKLVGDDIRICKKLSI